jgi:hypothetical protein
VLTFPGNRPFGLALDTEADEIYWTDFTAIRRADLNGTNVEAVVTGLERARGLAIVVPEPTAGALLVITLGIIALRRC